MGYVPRHEDFGSLATSEAPPKLEAPARKFGILRRIFDAFMDARQRDVDRQIARLLAARSGGHLTDNLEREISQRVLTSSWSVNTRPFSRHGRP